MRLCRKYIFKVRLPEIYIFVFSFVNNSNKTFKYNNGKKAYKRIKCTIIIFISRVLYIKFKLNFVVEYKISPSKSICTAFTSPSERISHIHLRAIVSRGLCDEPDGQSTTTHISNFCFHLVTIEKLTAINVA